MNALSDIFRKLTVPLLLTLAIALGFEYTTYTNTDSAVFGIHPRDLKFIHGIITVPLVHGNVSHLLNNLFAFLALSSLLYITYSKIAGRVMLLLWVLTGILMFLFARGEYFHIGASGVVYSLIFFLITAGFSNRTKTPLVIGLLVAFYYGGAIWGIFPLDERVSWDGHLAGLIAGFFIALFCQRKISKLYPKESHPDLQNTKSDYIEDDPYSRFNSKK